MAKKRPFGVTLLVILAVASALVAAYNTLQYLGIVSFSGPFGIFEFYSANWIGALIWALMVIIFIWVARMLWSLDPRGLIFVAAIASLNLILTGLSIIGESSWQAVLPSLIINGLILIYSLLPGTNQAFNVPAN